MRCEHSTAQLHNRLWSSAKGKRKASKTNVAGKNGRSEQKKVTELLCWMFCSWRAATVSVCREHSLNPYLAAVTCRGIDDVGCTLVFQSTNFILLLLYDLPKGSVVRTQNNEYYHPGDIPDSSFLIVL